MPLAISWRRPRQTIAAVLQLARMNSEKSIAKSLKPGRVYWITGLAGSGKSTLAHGLLAHLRGLGQAAVLLDGDVLREVLGETSGYDLASRERIAMRFSKLCHWLSEQGIPVVCATISMFHSCRRWNREQLQDYVEIFLDVPMDILIQRDQKGLYSAALRGEIQQVMGVDLLPEWPESPDLVLAGEAAPQAILEALLKGLLL